MSRLVWGSSWTTHGSLIFSVKIQNGIRQFSSRTRTKGLTSSSSSSSPRQQGRSCGFLCSCNSREGVWPRSEAVCSPSCSQLTLTPRTEQSLWRRRHHHHHHHHQRVAEQRS